MNPNRTPAHPRLRAYSDAAILIFTGLVATLLFALMALSLTGTALDFDDLGGANNGNGVEHGANPGQDGTSANPNGQGDGGNGIHDIQGIKQADGSGGLPPACVAHGGDKFQARNKNCGG